MTTTTADLVELDRASCWELVRAQQLGRLAYTDLALPSIRPLNYEVDGTHLLLRVSPKLADRLDGQVVAFEVDDIDQSARIGTTVVLIGTVRRTDEAEGVRASGRAPSWVAQPESVPMRLTIGRMDGRRLLRHAPLP